MHDEQAVKRYEWLEAAKSTERMFAHAPEKAQFVAESWEKLGIYSFLASRQAKDVKGFKRLTRQAVKAYKNAARIYENENRQESPGKKLECLATAEYLCSWLESNPVEKRRTLEGCLVLGRKALRALKNSKEKLHYGKTCNQLLLYAYDLQYIAPTAKEKRKVIQDGIRTAIDAVSIFSKIDEKDELITALSLGSILSWFLEDVCNQEEERKCLAKRCLEYSKRAIALSEDTENHYSKAISRWAVALSTYFLTEKSEFENSQNYPKEMLRNATIIKDNFLEGIAYSLLQERSIPQEEDPNKLKKTYEEGIAYSKYAVQRMKLVCRETEIGEIYCLYSYFYSELSRKFAVTLSEKIELAKKAVRIGKEGFRHATASGSPKALSDVLHFLSRAYYQYSFIETRKECKRKLLERSLSLRKAYVKTMEKAATNSLAIGLGLVNQAQIEADLAMLQDDRESKIAFLNNAISEMEHGVSCCKNYVGSSSMFVYVPLVAGFEDTLGKLLDERYFLTGNKESLKRANEVYDNAVKDFKKVDFPGRVAECFWKIARNLDLVGDYGRAAENFENAFKGYKAAAQKINQFGDFYLDYASYMKAWSEIETAKLEQKNKKYDDAIHHYEKASNLLKRSKSWSYLSTNFYAWSLLEQAEDLSRKEDSKHSIIIFEKTINSLQESKRVLSEALNKIGLPEEKNFVTRLLEDSDFREQYSQGRIVIEEAKILDKEGNHTASSEKYGSGAAIFQNLSERDTGQIGEEAKPLVYLCLAWQKMTIAEARGSSAMYAEAAVLFKQANEHSSGESESLLALGHSSYCRALQAGTEFENTRNMERYTEATTHLDAAANHYLTAGFVSSCEYAKATERLFDAYVFVDRAKREDDPENQVKFYLMAERVLDISAEAFKRAGYPAKVARVQRLLEKIREQKELALTLSEVFHAPTLTSTTASFSTIRPSMERAVGLERFEHTNLEVKVVQDKNEIKVGEDLSLLIQIVNVGKETAMITKIEGLVPDGFQLVSKLDDSSLEGTQLVVKRKRLDQMQTAEVKVALRPFRKGTFKIQPRIICMDENGQPMFFNPRPAAVAVSETVLSDRVSTGREDLDGLLLGGIPKNYAVILASPSSDETEQLIMRFLEAGATKDETTFHITTGVGYEKTLAQKYPTNFLLFVCNPQADVIIESFPNVFKLKGLENLTDIDIALTKAFRTLDPSRTNPKRICIEILSDALLQHHAVTTRRWLSALLPTLKAKGFTILAIIDPQMHTPEELQAILGVFEGEIRVAERETSEGIKQTLKIRKLYNQKYLENEINLTKERLSD